MLSHELLVHLRLQYLITVMIGRAPFNYFKVSNLKC